jgi:hydrogenase expression/formation protein HypD
VVGFAPTDVLQGVLHLIETLGRGAVEISNLYGRVVTAAGNRTARELVDRYFAPAPASWRGFGEIPDSGLALREPWRHRDAGTIAVDLPPAREPGACRCGDVLRGAIEPPECPLFAAPCSPDDPVGACMVSSEGTCAAWYRHEHWDRHR